MSLHPRLLNRLHAVDLGYESMGMEVDSCRWTRQGGPSHAEVVATASNEVIWRLDSILGYDMIIDNDRGEPFWWGYVDSIEITTNGTTIRIGLDDVFNSVGIRYVTASNEFGTVDFVEDARSIAIHGTKQKVKSANNVDATTAAQLAAVILSKTAYPKSTTTPFRSVSGGDVTVRLICRGWYETLAWMYFTRTEGRELYTPTSTQYQRLGWGVTSTEFGFEAAGRHFSNLSGRMRSVNKGDVLNVSGSATNDGDYTAEQGTSREPFSYTAGTISFDSTGPTILDSANGLGDFAKHDVVYISGSASNDGYHVLNSTTNDGSEMDTVGSVVTESAGATITISAGNRIVVEETLVDELPGASITVTMHGAKVAQSFTISSTAAWTAASVSVKARKVGGPSDNLTLAIHSNSSGAPNTLLDSATFDGAAVTTSGGWVSVDLTNTQTLALATTYWIVVSRTGANDTENYYEITVDEDAGASGSLLLYDGSGWVSRSTDASMAYLVEGSEDTGAQIEEILSACGQFASAYEVVTSGTSTNQWRYGDGKAIDEMESLMDLGTSNTLGMVATVTVDRVWQVTEEPAKTDTVNYSIDETGTLRNANGEPRGETYPPVGSWVEMLGIIPDGVPVTSSMNPSPFMLEAATYAAMTGSWQYDPRGMEDPWDIRVEEG